MILINQVYTYGGVAMRWDKKDIPHKGWIEIGMEDLGEEAEFGEEIQLLIVK